MRRSKEALRTFPDPETGDVRSLFTKRIVKTIPFELTDSEYEFYTKLTEYVEEQSHRAASDNSSRGRALGFTMALLQRRFASSIYAVRKSLERMKDRREWILNHPDEYRNQVVQKKLPENYDELPEDERDSIWEDLESSVLYYDPNELKEEIIQLNILIGLAKSLEDKNIESKIIKLQELLHQEEIFTNYKTKLLIFTEHKDTLDYLAGNGKDGKPLGKLIQWGLSVSQIHGSMKVGSINEVGSRIYAEKEFKEKSQILIATEAAGEGINLQFCWMMINFDIPWNPVRLEQRMGRIHRYGQEKDCLIFNFVSINTREGRVLNQLFEKVRQIELDLDPNQTGLVFNVLGDIFPKNDLEKQIRELYARSISEEAIFDRIKNDVDTEKFKKITESALEGLSKKELNLSAILGKTAEAKERRLVPEVMQSFFIQASSYHGITIKEKKDKPGQFVMGKVPRSLWTRGEKLEPKYGVLGKEYSSIVFSKETVEKYPELEWITPGHPLFECVREETLFKFQTELQKGSIFYDLHTNEPYTLDVFTAEIIDGLGRILNKRIFVVLTKEDGSKELRQPTIYLDISCSNNQLSIEIDTIIQNLSTMQSSESFLSNTALQMFKKEISDERKKQISIIEQHVEWSLQELIEKQTIKHTEYIQRQDMEGDSSNYAGTITQIDNRIMELNHRLDKRRSELKREKECSLTNITQLGRSIVIPHPEREKPEIKDMVSDLEIEKIAIQKAIQYEKSQGYIVESVEKDNRGFDLISRKPHPNDTQTSVDVRFIEVKGRSNIGEVALTANEYRTAQRLKEDYWLYVVYNCSTEPELFRVKNPVKLNWKEVVRVEHYHTSPEEIRNIETRNF